MGVQVPALAVALDGDREEPASGVRRDRQRLVLLAVDVEGTTAYVVRDDVVVATIGNPARVDGVIKDELLEIRNTYADERRTERIRRAAPILQRLEAGQ